MSNWKEFTKKYLLWPFLIPLGIVVVLDYAQIIAKTAQLLCAAYIIVQGAGFLLGVWLGMLARLGVDSPWQDVLKYRINKFLPTIKWGKLATDWSLSEDETQ
jgi:hypothetical protein